jgi:hypothetical protein
MPRYSKKKGGSKASDLVMETSKPVLCDGPESPVIHGKPINANINDFTLYRTTGGGSKCQSCSCGQVGGSPASDIVQGSINVCPQTNEVSQVNNNSAGNHRLSMYRTTGGGTIHAGVGDNCLSNANGQSGGKRNKKGRKAKKSKNMKGAGGSDWRSTLYSRGPVNVPNQDPATFRMFTQHGDYIPQDALRDSSLLKGGKRNSKKNSKKRLSKSKKSKSKSLRRKNTKSKSKTGGSLRSRNSNKFRSDYRKRR